MLKRGTTVSGTIEPGALTPEQLQKVRITLFPILGAADWEAPLRRVGPDPEGRFTISPVGPGPYRVTLSGLPEGWSLDAATFGGTDAADVDLEVKDEDVANGRVTLTSRAGELSGTLSDAKAEPVAGRTVVLFPEERQFWVPSSRRIHVVQSGPDGRYLIRNLPAGDYRVAVADLSDTGQQFDREFLAGIAREAVAVTLAAGATHTEQMRVR